MAQWDISKNRWGTLGQFTWYKSFIFRSATMEHPVPMCPTVYFLQKNRLYQKIFEVAIEQTMYIIEHR